MNSPGLSSAIWFIAILAMIPLVLWLLKRTPMGGGTSNSLLRTVSVLPLSPGQRVVIVEAGNGADRTWLVLGVTGQQITTLHTMPPQDSGPPGGGQTTHAPGTLAASPFAQLIDKLRDLPSTGPRRDA